MRISRQFEQPTNEPAIAVAAGWMDGWMVASPFLPLGTFTYDVRTAGGERRVVPKQTRVLISCLSVEKTGGVLKIFGDIICECSHCAVCSFV